MPLEAGHLELVFADQTTESFLPIGLHFHAPSEHTFNGKHCDLELHIVHKYSDDQTLGAVLGIMFSTVDDGSLDSDKDNLFLESLKPHLATTEGTQADSVDMAKFLSEINFNEFYSYEGSLTTPPCTEGIKWTILKEVRPISKRQLEWFQGMGSPSPDEKLQGNNRRVQPILERTVYTTTSDVQL